jgi:hypothetical protein
VKLITLILAGAALTGIITVEMWHLSGQRFWLFCALLVFVSQSIFLSAKLLGDNDAAKALGWRFSGFSDWAVTSIFLAVIVLGFIACSVVTYQLISFAPVRACGEICLP